MGNIPKGDWRRDGGKGGAGTDVKTNGGDRIYLLLHTLYLHVCVVF